MAVITKRPNAAIIHHPREETQKSQLRQHPVGDGSVKYESDSQEVSDGYSEDILLLSAKLFWLIVVVKKNTTTVDDLCVQHEKNPPKGFRYCSEKEM